jgi:predicted transcriptional regulator
MAISIQLDPEIEQRLDHLVANTGRRSLTSYANSFRMGLMTLKRFIWPKQL